MAASVAPAAPPTPSCGGAFWDVDLGMFLSRCRYVCYYVGDRATLHKAGQTKIGSAAEAAEALRPLAGDGAFLLNGAGPVGTGVLAVPILTGSARLRGRGGVRLAARAGRAARSRPSGSTWS